MRTNYATVLSAVTLEWERVFGVAPSIASAVSRPRQLLRHSVAVSVLKPSISIERVKSSRMSSAIMAEVVGLCDTAYATDTARFFKSLGPGDHLLGRSNGTIVSHLMWITRWLQPEGSSPLRTAYIEMVATTPSAQRKGYASTLLAHFPSLVEDFELAALCPATEGLYIQLGWRFWRGPLAARKADRIVETPGERVMVLWLPNTPPLDLNNRLSVEWREGEVW